MSRVSRKLIFAVILALVLYYLLSRLRLVVLLHVSLWQGLIFVGVVVLVLFLIVDHLLNAERRPAK